jgi:hypothetical protein
LPQPVYSRSNVAQWQRSTVCAEKNYRVLSSRPFAQEQRLQTLTEVALTLGKQNKILPRQFGKLCSCLWRCIGEHSPQPDWLPATPAGTGYWQFLQVPQPQRLARIAWRCESLAFRLRQTCAKSKCRRVGLAQTENRIGKHRPSDRQCLCFTKFLGKTGFALAGFGPFRHHHEADSQIHGYRKPMGVANGIRGSNRSGEPHRTGIHEGLI